MNTTPAENPPITILLVEDNLADIELTRFALEEAGVKHILQIAEDGEEALQYITRKGKFKDAEIPDVVFLDLNMPKISGKEVLKEIKKDIVWSNIPVIILTSSQAKADITDAYRLEANYYITKPITTKKIVAAFDTNSTSEWFLE